jgi:hypothetical protein
MAQVTREFLIKAMHTYPKNDLEMGFNSALIYIMKTLTDSPLESDAPTSDDNEPDVYNKLRTAFINTNNSREYKLLSKTQLADIIHESTNIGKLPTVKTIKDYTGLGLMKSKDIADNFFNLCGI